ncbi:MAG: DUF4105 domain-containing protein [Lewinellaceae bacterium]|nr:DUF4105 domain-containing protein [Lewinellaceae bacterium]
MRTIKHCIFFALLLWSLSVSSQKPLPESTTISVITCSPGNDIYTIYGHTALRVNDAVSGHDYVFNYGTFDFETPGFIQKFLLGRLPYFLSVGNFERFKQSYADEGRGIIEQSLFLSDTQKSVLIDTLWKNAMPENREYLYDFFFDNCSTRVRDVVGLAVHTDWEGNETTHKTFRKLIKEFQQNLPWTNFGIDLIIGAKADRETTVKESCFLPSYLMSAINKIEPKIVETNNTLLPVNLHPHKKTFIQFFFSPFNIFFILLLLEFYFISDITNSAMLKFRMWYDRLWIFLLILSGFIMLFMWFGTDHQVTKNNWNLLWVIVPLPIFLIKNLPHWLYKIVDVLLSLVLVDLIFNTSFIPQTFNQVIGLIVLILMVRVWRYKNSNVKKIEIEPQPTVA